MVLVVVVVVVAEEGGVFSWEVVDVVRSVTSVVSGGVVGVSFCCCEVVSEEVSVTSGEMVGSGVVPKINLNIRPLFVDY